MSKKIGIYFLIFFSFWFFSPSPAKAGGVADAAATAFNVVANASAIATEYSIGVPLDVVGIDNGLVEDANCRSSNMSGNPFYGNSCGGSGGGNLNQHTEVDLRTNDGGGNDSGCNYHECGVCGQPCRGLSARSNVVYYIGSDCEPHGYPCGAPPQPPVCGDGSCNGTETCFSCPSDCGVCRCTGSQPNNTNDDTLCPGAGSGLTANTPKKQVNGTGGCTGAKCEYRCIDPSAKTASNCFPPEDGACNSSTEKRLFCQAPTSNLCSKGESAGAFRSGNEWKWTCKGRYGGSDVNTCHALKSCAYREVVPN